jgi:CRP-like cAMP-binding protein
MVITAKRSFGDQSRHFVHPRIPICEVFLLRFYSHNVVVNRPEGPALGISNDEDKMATTTESPCKRAREHTGPDGRLILNWILNGVPESEFHQMRPHLEPVPFSLGETVLRQESEVAHAIFLNRGLVSLVTTLSEGRSSQVSITGCEGMIGIGLVGGLQRSVHSAVVQVEGDGFRLSASCLGHFLETAGVFRRLLTKYCAIQLMLVSQTAVCNRVHSVEKRLARWLLLCQDRLSSNTIKITHDFLSMLLGTDRPSVTLAAQKLQNEGILRTTRGNLSVLTRRRLEESSCECYAATAQFNRDLGLLSTYL